MPFQGVRAMRDRPTRTQRPRDENGFSDLPIGRAESSRIIRVDCDPIGALRRARDREHHQYLYFPGMAQSATTDLSKATNERGELPPNTCCRISS